MKCFVFPRLSNFNVRMRFVAYRNVIKPIKKTFLVSESISRTAVGVELSYVKQASVLQHKLISIPVQFAFINDHASMLIMHV